MIEERFCLACEKVLRGRIDKRFCDSDCRNLYNNQLHVQANNYVRKVDRDLKKNRRILKQSLGEEKMVKVNKDKLLAKGFRTDLFTRQLVTAKGQVYFFVYEYGYLPLEGNLFLLVKQRVAD